MARKRKSDIALQPATALWDMYRPEEARYAFHADNRAEARRWQTKTRRALSRLLGLDRIPSAPAQPHVVEKVDRGTYVREKIVMQTGPHTLMPVYILHPKEAAGVPPTVLALHGHGYGVKDIVGLWEDGSERTVPDGYHKDFGVALCKAGFTVVAPEISCFGERRRIFPTLTGILDRKNQPPAPTLRCLPSTLESPYPACAFTMRCGWLTTWKNGMMLIRPALERWGSPEAAPTRSSPPASIRESARVS